MSVRKPNSKTRSDAGIHRLPNSDIVSEIIRLYAVPTGINEIAKKIKLNGKTVTRILLENRIEIRPKWKTIHNYNRRLYGRKRALLAGEIRYSDGKACALGHLERFTSTGKSCECSRLKKVTEEYRRVAKIQWERWRDQNVEKVRLSKRMSQNRRRAKIQENDVSVSDINNLLNKSGGKCHICKKKFTKNNPYTIDHVVALSRGGGNVISNIAFAHKSCNCRKNSARTHLI